MLKPITVPIDCLLLDPNNPRFVTDLNIEDVVQDDQIETKQDFLLTKFDSSAGVNDKDDFFSIDDLKDSMREVGYVGIDRIVVRRISADKYVVLEGNRRTSTIKILRKNHVTATPNDKINKLKDHVAETFKEIEVMELVCDGLTKEQIDERISIILGLRHFGSLLEWEPLPRAYNMFHNYMNIEPKLDSFLREQKRVKDVASRLSIKQPEVRKVLKTYICYLQLSENYSGVEDKYYSLLQAAITNNSLTGNGYLNIDDNTYQLDEPSQERLYNVCQFEDRGKRPTKQTIVRDPKQFKQLGQLVKKSKSARSEAVRSYAEGLLQQVQAAEIDQETGELSLSLDAAVDALNEFEANTEWVATMVSLLEKQGDELLVEHFKGSTSEILQKEKLEESLNLLRRIFQV